jgi:hypothetical protein
LAAAGVSSTIGEVRESENIQPQEDNRVLDIVPNSENRESGEIRSESTSGVEEDLAEVDANPRDLIVAKSSKSYPPSFDFGESKVTANLIREYEVVGFFVLAMVALLLMSKPLLLKQMKLSCFATYLTAN